MVLRGATSMVLRGATSMVLRGATSMVLRGATSMVLRGVKRHLSPSDIGSERRKKNVSEAALTTIQRELERDTEILKLIGELKNVFENHFDRTWFSLIIDGMPIDFRTVRDIRELVSLTSLYPGEERQIY